MPPPTNPQPNWVKEKEKHGDSFCAEWKQMCKVICNGCKSRPICKLVAFATAHWSGTFPIPNDVRPTQSQQFIWYAVSFIWWQTQDGCLCCSKTFFVFCYLKSGGQMWKKSSWGKQQFLSTATLNGDFRSFLCSRCSWSTFLALLLRYSNWLLVY